MAKKHAMRNRSALPDSMTVDLYFVRKYVEHLNKKYIGEIHHWVINAPHNTPYLDIREYSSCNF